VDETGDEMGYTMHSSDFETRVDLACGGTIYLNLRGGRTSPQREVPLVYVLYEGAAPERDMDYYEMSLFLLDGVPMVGNVPIESAQAPEIQFYNLSDEVNRVVSEAARMAFAQFRDGHLDRLVQLARSNSECKEASSGPALTPIKASPMPVATKKGRRRKADDPTDAYADFKLPEGFFAP
jgi:hypothetical protein